MGSSSLPSSPSRGLASWLITICFGLLALAFSGRMVQYAYQWLSGVSKPEVNFKVLTIASLIYAVICATIALVVYRLSGRGESTDTAIPGEPADK